ncbi:MAG: hypothetical protein WKF79_04335 [Nocardioides sp.]
MDPPGRAHGVVAPVRVDPHGITGPTKREASGREWRRSSRGLYVPAYVDQSPHQRIVEAAVLVPEYGALTGWAGLSWLGGSWFNGLESDTVTFRPVPIALSRHSIKPQDVIRLCEERFDPREVLIVDGVKVTSAVRSLWFEMRYSRNVRAAVAVFDMTAFDDLVSLDEMHDYAHAHPSYTGIEQCRAAVPLGDENTWSPQETKMRLVWTRDTRVPQPLTNRPVFDLNGRHIGTPDLLEPKTGVAGEYNGEHHFNSRQQAHDLKREHLFRSHGLEPVVMVAEDGRYGEPFAQRLRSAYARAVAKPSSERRWTLAPPHWWQDTSTVAQRLALTDEQRRAWLRRRAA